MGIPGIKRSFCFTMSKVSMSYVKVSSHILFNNDRTFGPVSCEKIIQLPKQ